MSKKASTLTRMGVLFRRDLSLELSYHFQFAVRVFQMFMFTTSLFFISKLVNNPPELQRYGGRYFEFVVVGLIVVLFVNLGIGSFTNSISDEQRAGTLEIVLASPTGLATLLAGSFLTPLLLTVTQTTLYLTTAILLFRAHIPLSGLPLALPLLALTVLSFCALGVMSASFIILTKRGDPISLVAVQAGTLFAGVFFPTSVLPGPLEAVTRFVPAYYGLDGLRAVLLTGAGLGEVRNDLLWLTVFAVVLVPVSLWTFGRAIRAARVTGTLGNY
jgi:ABC-2 type transport system permease protein